MKAHILQVLVLDHGDDGAESAKTSIDCNRYPAHCTALSHETYDIGEWDDDHPLNQIGVDVMAWLKSGAKHRPGRCPFEQQHGSEGCAYCPQERG